jgi:TetR/AcrR family transcriptional regulator, cholesterol catabolism regulator
MQESTTISRKEQIIKTSKRLFKEKGFVGTSMRDIAAELEIEAASLYSHIKSKDEILEEICFRKADEFLKAIDEINDIYFNSEEKLRMAVKSHVKILCNDLDSSSVFLHEWRHLTEPKLKILLSFETVMKMNSEQLYSRVKMKMYLKQWIKNLLFLQYFQL